MSITYNELLHGHLISDVPLTAQMRLEVLLTSINAFRAVYGHQMIVTSGYRSEADQRRINASAPHSKHRTGDAVDISDPDGYLYAYCYASQDILEQCGLWCELGTHGWVHFQCVPFGSYKPNGTRFFAP